MNAVPQPGSVIQLRSATWKVMGTSTLKRGFREVHCRGLSGLLRDKEARFVWDLEKGAPVLDPAAGKLVPDASSGLIDTKLHLAAAFRATPTTTRRPLTLSRTAIDDLTFQRLPVERALAQDRVRLLIADDVGLGKTLEAGLITSELVLRGRGDRILVATTRAMLSHFQKEFWTRFSIPLSRLDSAAIRRRRNKIPAHYNVFDQFDRSIVSIDTLKWDNQIRGALKHSYWDLIIDKGETMAEPEGEILTLGEVAAHLKAGKRTAYRLAAEGKVPAFKLDGTWRFSRADIDSWIRQQANQVLERTKK